ncbi:MAG: hypothetical protein CMM95_01580 [Rickettsiales bacterium]|nr:hypothetical protein [Rickettsiales bacterium]
MQIDIISPGKFKKNPPYSEIFYYYKKRIKIKVNLIELKLYNFDIKKKILFEKQDIKKHLKDNNCIVTLDKSGKKISSREFAIFMNQKLSYGEKKISFIIGSESGLDDSFKKKKNVLSFGNQTWPHLMVRIMLMEQIYRALEIIKGTLYHK